MSISLDKLPTELVGNIATFLPTRCVFNLICTSRHMHAMWHHYFVDKIRKDQDNLHLQIRDCCSRWPKAEWQLTLMISKSSWSVRLNNTVPWGKLSTPLEINSQRGRIVVHAHNLCDWTRDLFIDNAITHLFVYIDGNYRADLCKVNQSEFSSYPQ